MRKRRPLSRGRSAKLYRKGRKQHPRNKKRYNMRGGGRG